MKSAGRIAATLLFLGLANSASAASWVVETGQSRLGFAGNQSGTVFEGRFTNWQADIDFDPARPAAGHAVVTIDMASAVTGDATRDQSLPQADWFAVKAFPQARFEAREFRARGGNAFETSGDLTIRGVKKPVVLPFTLDIDGDVAHAKGRLSLLRTDFGVGQGAWSTAEMVGLEVSVTIDLTARRR